MAKNLPSQLLQQSLRSFSADVGEGGDYGDRRHHGPNPNEDGGVELNIGGKRKRLDMGADRMERTCPKRKWVNSMMTKSAKKITFINSVLSL